MNETIIIIIITLIFIALDITTGIIKAFKEKNYTSSYMRDGLYHKCGSVICIAFSTLIDYTQKYIDVGVSVPLTKAICVYIVLMEIGSIIENICLINPDIMPDKLKQYFKKLTK